MNTTTTVRTNPNPAAEVARTYRVTFPMPRPSDGKVVNLPVMVVATKTTAHNKAAAILRARLGLPSSHTVMGKVEEVHGPIGAEAVATNDNVVPPLNKRRTRAVQNKQAVKV